MGDSKPIIDPLCPDPPKALVDREVRVALNQVTTIRVADDVPSPDPKRWFTKLVDGLGNALPVTDNNEVTYLIDGPKTFEAMTEAIRSTFGDPVKARRGYYIYLLGWYLEDRLVLVPGHNDTEVVKLLVQASENDVQIRVMLWKQRFAEQAAVVETADRINGKTDIIVNGVKKRIKSGGAIIDSRTLRFGCHHQKILVVSGKDGLQAFCGGLDINTDRLEQYHDVHCRIRGSGALELSHIFEQRWDDHPDSKEFDEKEPLRSLSFRDVVLTGKQHYVQVARTFGNGKKHSGIRNVVVSSAPPPVVVTAGYKFAPEGEQTVKAMVLHAIKQARRFIYMEELYLVNMDVSRALEDALGHIEHLTILMTESGLLPEYDPGDVRPFWGRHQADYRRQKFLAPLWNKARDKVHVFTLNAANKPHNYVHAKTWIMDDEFAIIGSANCNRRSYTHDSDAIAGISDAPSKSGVKYTFAHRLRIALWAEHLGMDTQEGHAELADGVASVVHWLKEPQPKIKPYPELSGLERLPGLTPLDVPAELGWAYVADPDGS
jgi:phosphatidylserine/phosphatidylglycerophosphate/cardiolipin synthase-like enzyme